MRAAPSPSAAQASIPEARASWIRGKGPTPRPVSSARTAIQVRSASSPKVASARPAAAASTIPATEVSLRAARACAATPATQPRSMGKQAPSIAWSKGVDRAAPEEADGPREEARYPEGRASRPASPCSRASARSCDSRPSGSKRTGSRMPHRSPRCARAGRTRGPRCARRRTGARVRRRRSRRYSFRNRRRAIRASRPSIRRKDFQESLNGTPRRRDGTRRGTFQASPLRVSVSSR